MADKLNWGNEERIRRTAQAFNDPQVGDRFSEMLSFWVYVLHVGKNLVVYMEGIPPCTLPKDGKVHVTTREGFRKAFAYTTGGGYWVQLVDRGNNVEGWYAPPEVPQASEPYLEIWE